VVIDDHDVGFDGLAARVEHVTAAGVGAAGAQAVLPRRGYLRPQRVRVAEVGHFDEVPAAGDLGPALDPRKRAIACAGEAALRAVLLEPVGAQVVGPALEQRHPHRHADGAGDERQILVEQLVLKRACPGRDEHAPAREQRRHEIGESLARAGTRLHHQPRAVFDGHGDPLRHRELRAARREARQRARQRAVGSEYLV
jgi:hypothetical protein